MVELGESAIRAKVTAEWNGNRLKVVVAKHNSRNASANAAAQAKEAARRKYSNAPSKYYGVLS